MDTQLPTVCCDKVVKITILYLGGQACVCVHGEAVSLDSTFFSLDSDTIYLLSWFFPLSLYYDYVYY